MVRQAKAMRNVVLLNAHITVTRYSLKQAFLKGSALLHAREHLEMENLHPLIFASSATYPHGYNHVLFFPLGISCLLLPATAPCSAFLCLATEPFVAEYFQ